MTKSIDTPTEAKTSPVPHHSNSSMSEDEQAGKKQQNEKMVPGTFLGIDFGMAKIGLAIADEETRMAFAYDTLPNDKEIFSSLKEVAACENVQAIIIGMTKHDKDDESVKTKENFASQLAKEISVPVYFQEEMFTTLSAQRNIKMRGGKNIAASDDQEAARIILQDWLDGNA